jgi:hypothetical protein
LRLSGRIEQQLGNLSPLEMGFERDERLECLGCRN